MPQIYTGASGAPQIGGNGSLLIPIGPKRWQRISSYPDWPKLHGRDTPRIRQRPSCTSRSTRYPQRPREHVRSGTPGFAYPPAD